MQWWSKLSEAVELDAGDRRHRNMQDPRDSLRTGANDERPGEDERWVKSFGRTESHSATLQYLGEETASERLGTVQDDVSRGW